MDKRAFFERMQTIDRRWIFILIACAVVIPMAFDLRLAEPATPEVTPHDAALITDPERVAALNQKMVEVCGLDVTRFRAAAEGAGVPFAEPTEAPVFYNEEQYQALWTHLERVANGEVG